MISILSKLSKKFTSKNKPENIVKNQHYIPESLLWNFANQNNKIIEVLLSTKKIYPTNPANSMSQKFVYEHDSLKKNTVEKYFAEIDYKVDGLVKQILSNIKQVKNEKLSIQNFKRGVEALLPIFIIFYYRSGALLTEFSSIRKTDKVPLLSKKILNHQYINALGETVKRGYNFSLIESNGNFLLSDQFLSTSALNIKSNFFDISNRHIGLTETLILIPLSSSYYVAYWHSKSDFFAEKDKICELDSDQIRLINRSIINNSYVKCIGEKKESIEEVLDDYKMKFPSQIYAGGNPSGYFRGAIKKKEVFFFKKDQEAFDMIEFLSYGQYKNLGRNDICACKSGKKFKNCHQDVFIKAERVTRTFGTQTTTLRNSFGIPNAITYELPVDHWEGFDKNNKLKS